MEWLIPVLVVGAAGVVLVWVLSRRKRQPHVPDDFIADQHKHAADALRTLRNGDVVEYLGHNWFVRGRLDFDEHGYLWTEHMLDDADTKRWLSVEDDESIEVSLWRSIGLGDVEQGSPGDRDVVVEGVAYRIQERGTAHFSALGATGTAPSGSVEYADYKSMDGNLLGFEKFGSSWAASLGEALHPWELTVFPSTDRPASL